MKKLSTAGKEAVHGGTNSSSAIRLYLSLRAPGQMVRVPWAHTKKEFWDNRAVRKIVEYVSIQ